MSICDEGWEPEVDDGYKHECPCLDSYSDREDGSWCCTLDYFERHSQLNKSQGKLAVQDLRPDTCPHVPILKLLIAADDVGEFVLDEQHPMDGVLWERYQIWIRR